MQRSLSDTNPGVSFVLMDLHLSHYFGGSKKSNAQLEKIRTYLC